MVGSPFLSERCQRTRHGKGEPELRAALGVIRNRDPPAARRDDRLADGETHAHSAFLCGEKALKDAIKIFDCDSWPAVANRKGDRVVLVGAGLEVDPAPR